MQKTNKLNRLVYAEDVLKNIYRERVYMGDVGYIHAKAAVNDAPTVDAIEVIHIKAYLLTKLEEWENLGDRRFEPANMWGYNFIMACFDDLNRRAEDGN